MDEQAPRRDGCFFCGSPGPEPKHSADVELYQVLDSGRSVNVIEVPRCAACFRRHILRAVMIVVGYTALVVTGALWTADYASTALRPIMAEPDSDAQVLFTAVLAGIVIVGFLIGAFMYYVWKWALLRRHPEVARLRRAGWTIRYQPGQEG